MLSPSAPARRRVGVLDALVVLALGLALTAVGWVDLRAYRASTKKTVASFGLVGQPGDTRLGDDEFFYQGALIIHLSHVGAVERDGDATFRHALGPAVTIETWSTQALEQVDFAFECGFAQDITVTHNGQVLEQAHLAPGRITRSYHVKLRPGSNQFTIAFEVYNHHGIEFENRETRPLAGTFRQLDVHF